MTLEEAFEMTQTNNKAELARFLAANGEPVTKAAITKWYGVVPDSSILRIFRALDIYDEVMDFAYEEATECH